MIGPITTQELCGAIKKQKKGKVPGPDGLLASYYKSFEDFLKNFYNPCNRQ